MAKQKYTVVIPWHGVKAGETVEFQKVPNALKPNVRLLAESGSNLADKAKAEAEQIIKDAEDKAAEIIKAAEEKAADADKAKAGKLTPATTKAATAK